MIFKTKLKLMLPLFAVALLCSQAPHAALDMPDPGLMFWLNLLGAEEQNALESLGTSYTEIEPTLIQSRAERILWYPGGITLWLSGNQISQIRFDSAAEGEVGGISIGATSAEVTALFGEPWIESDGSFYYNLPWRSGPARLRFVFDTGGDSERLLEVYLYLVR